MLAQQTMRTGTKLAVARTACRVLFDKCSGFVDSESRLILEALGHRVPVHEISYTHGHMVSGGVGHRVDHEKLLLGRLARDTGDLPAMQASVQLA